MSDLQSPDRLHSSLESLFPPGKVVIWIPQETGTITPPNQKGPVRSYKIDQAVITEVVGIHPSLNQVRVKNVFYQGEGDASTMLPASRLIPTYTESVRPTGTEFYNNKVGFG